MWTRATTLRVAMGSAMALVFIVAIVFSLQSGSSSQKVASLAPAGASGCTSDRDCAALNDTSSCPVKATLGKCLQNAAGSTSCIAIDGSCLPTSITETAPGGEPNCVTNADCSQYGRSSATQCVEGICAQGKCTQVLCSAERYPCFTDSDCAFRSTDSCPRLEGYCNLSQARDSANSRGQGYCEVRPLACTGGSSSSAQNENIACCKDGTVYYYGQKPELTPAEIAYSATLVDSNKISACALESDADWARIWYGEVTTERLAQYANECKKNNSSSSEPTKYTVCCHVEKGTLLIGTNDDVTVEDYESLADNIIVTDLATADACADSKDNWSYALEGDDEQPLKGSLLDEALYCRKPGSSSSSDDGRTGGGITGGYGSWFFGFRTTSSSSMSAITKSSSSSAIKKSSSSSGKSSSTSSSASRGGASSAASRTGGGYSSSNASRGTIDPMWQCCFRRQTLVVGTLKDYFLMQCLSQGFVGSQIRVPMETYWRDIYPSESAKCKETGMSSSKSSSMSSIRKSSSSTSSSSSVARTGMSSSSSSGAAKSKSSSSSSSALTDYICDRRLTLDTLSGNNLTPENLCPYYDPQKNADALPYSTIFSGQFWDRSPTGPRSCPTACLALKTIVACCPTREFMQRNPQINKCYPAEATVCTQRNQFQFLYDAHGVSECDNVLRQGYCG